MTGPSDQAVREQALDARQSFIVQPPLALEKQSFLPDVF